MSGGANQHDDRSQDDDAYVSEFSCVPVKDGANEHDDRSQDDDAYVSEFFGVPMKGGSADTPTATPEDCCCFDCGYDLRAAKRHKSPTSDDPKDALLRCPECGWVGTLATASSHRALKHRQVLGRNALVVSAMAALMNWGSTGAAFAYGGETGYCACCCAGMATPIAAVWLTGVRTRARLVSKRLSNVALAFAVPAVDCRFRTSASAVRPTRSTLHARPARFAHRSSRSRIRASSSSRAPAAPRPTRRPVARARAARRRSCPCSATTRTARRAAVVASRSPSPDPGTRGACASLTVG